MEQMALRAVFPSFGGGERFPVEHTGRGADRSPEIRLENLSPLAKTLAVTLEDIDHPIPGFPHWTIWDLPAGPLIPGALPPGKHLPSGAVQGLGYGLHRYAGPKPPRGRTHRYRFTVYALDCALGLGASAGKWRLSRAIKGHILQKTEFIAAFTG